MIKDLLDSGREEYNKINKYKDRCLSITEGLFLIITGLYLAYLTLQTTMFSFVLPDWVGLLIPLLFTFAVLPRIIVQLDNKMIWCAIVASIAYYISWDSDYLPIVALMTIGCVGISYKKILKVYMISVGCIVSGTILVALGGGVTNLVYIRDGYLRSSFGSVYTLNLLALIIYIFVAFWVYRTDIPDLFTLFIPIFLFGVSMFIMRGRTGMICSALLGVVIIYLIFEKKIVDKRDKLKWIKNVVDFLMQAAFPIFTFVSLFLIWAFKKGYTFAIVADRLLSYRLTWSIRAFNENRISAFGAPLLNQNGSGGTTFEMLDFNFLDSSYPRIMLMYGIVVLILLNLLWIVITRRAIKAGNRRMALMLVLIAFHAISEYYYIKVIYNIYLIMPFAILDCDTKDTIGTEKFIRPDRIAFITGCAVALLISPAFISCFRIWIDNCINQVYMLLAAIILIVVIALFISGLSHVIGDVFGHKKPERINMIISICSFAILALFGVIMSSEVNKSMTRYSEIMEDDRNAIETIEAVGKGNIYVNKLGELYRRKFNGISRSLLDGEDLARFSDTTVIVDEDFDSLVFKKRGFLYSRISDKHAVYTNNEAVINALDSAGYKTTAYCTAVYSADLGSNGTIDLKEGKRSYTVGAASGSMNNYSKDDINLYFGRYNVNFHLIIDPKPYDEDYEVCRISVTAFDNGRTVRDIGIYRSWFDDKGELDAKVLFKTGNYPMMQYSITASKDQEVTISSVTWERDPEYDIHTTYNKNHKKERESYFDFDGKPVMNAYGYASVKYNYGDTGVIDSLEYYDLDGEKTNISKGYAKLKKTYNIKRQLLREEYYDADNRLVLNKDGYAIREWEYDDNGKISGIRFLGTEGNPVMTEYGYAKTVREYDDKQRILFEKYYGTDDKRIMTKYGNSGIRRQYDGDGVLQRMIYLDTEDNPVLNVRGCASVKPEYDSNKNIISEEYYDLNDRPVMLNAGYASTEYIYDLAGNVWCYKFYDLDHTPVMTKDGFAEIHREYDEHNRVIKESYYDLNNNLIGECPGSKWLATSDERNLIKDDSDTSDLDGFDPEVD